MSEATAEHDRLADHALRKADWRHWGPYLSDRAWGTVREDYSADGDAWDYLPHDQARSKAYRWGEDGLAGISDREGRLMFALALWNGHDPILKERLFGLNGHEGNHGEDVKEYYYYLDNTPTHSYMCMLYKYPQAPYPYSDLLGENRRRGRGAPEYELADTGIFEENRYFDVRVEYAKADTDDLLVLITVTNRGPDRASLHLLPTLWFRNTWAWGYDPTRPQISRAGSGQGRQTLQAEHQSLGTYWFYADEQPVAPDLLFTENETNNTRLYNAPNPSPYVKDGFHRYLVAGEAGAVNADGPGTKAAFDYSLDLDGGETAVIRLRLTNMAHDSPLHGDFDNTFAARHREADAFYAAIQAPHLGDEERTIQRQALAGMLWSKQLYYYDVTKWLDGDPAFPPPPTARKHGRNSDWTHMTAFDVISMPDKWEYPWFATWDLAFHCIPLALMDPAYAKRQLLLLTREWYQHPNGQLPAYEWAFDDVNPPVHAWAAWRIYQMEIAEGGQGDRAFLEGIFHKLLLNFTWWVNRKDEDGNNVFQGGFLGLDNIGVFNRDAKLPDGSHLEQADGTAWMASYCLQMLTIALELAGQDRVYEDIATKFFEHFLRIAAAVADMSDEGISLWDPEDGFFYDALHLPDGQHILLKVRSLVGLLPLFAVSIIEPELLERLPVFRRRMEWFLSNRPNLAGHIAEVDRPGVHKHRLFSILTRERLERVLGYMLDENEFLSDYGIRSLSKYHEAHPYSINLAGEEHTVNYEPAESQTGVFGGNSNWRGPIWFPVNYLIIESLLKFNHYYGDSFKVECPTGSGTLMTLEQVADEIAHRLIALFLRDKDGKRPIYGGISLFQDDPHWRDMLFFNEYFHGDNGFGLGADHQTGWTGLIAMLLQEHTEFLHAEIDPYDSEINPVLVKG
ncbi:MAG: MGH1-like glycoside hydrolase domain-containing protein [Chloroflexia bacterium]